MFLAFLTAAAWACSCFGRADPITPAHAPPNARITLDIPTYYDAQNPFTLLRIDDGPGRVVRTVERRQGQSTRVTVSHGAWPEGAHILVARGDGTRWDVLLQTRITLPRDTTAPTPEG